MHAFDFTMYTLMREKRRKTVNQEEEEEEEEEEEIMGIAKELMRPMIEHIQHTQATARLL